MKKKTLHQLSGKISFGVRIASAFLLMANLILPWFQAFADPAPEQTLKWYYIHDEASWNTAYNAVNSPLKKYLDSNRTEDRWSNTYNRACNSTDWDNQTNPTKFVDDAQCVPSWLWAINNPGAKYPWAALELPDTFNGTITFQYDWGEIKYPWGKHITRTNWYWIASIPEEIDMNFILNTNGETTFNPDNLVVKIIPETLDYLDENEEWFYIWNESTWNAAYDAEHPDVDLTDDSSFAKTPLHRYLDRNPDEDRWCDADGEGGNPGHYGQAVDKENNGWTWPNYCVQSWEWAINATDAKYPRIILWDNDITPERHKWILVFKYKDAVKQTNKYNEYDVSENGWRLYYARSIPAEKDGLSWTEFLLENWETSFDKSKFTVLLVTHVNDAITLEKADETTPVEYEAQIWSQWYATVVEAINAAQNDEMVEILKSWHYVLPDISKSITIKWNVDGVTFDHEKISDNTYKISEISANVVFDNISFNLTWKANQDHKIVNTASITMSGCTFNGYIQTDWEIIFNNCKFNGKSAEYALYIGKGNVTVNWWEIIWQNWNIVNFFYYDNPLGTEQNTVRFDGTKFTNVWNARKSALNVKEVQRLSANEWHEDIFNYDITINNCTTEWEFPTDKKWESKLWMVDHLIGSLDENWKAATRIENATWGSISYWTLNWGWITIKDGSDKVLYSTPIHQYTITWNYKTATWLDISDTTNVWYNTTPMHTESGYVLNYRNYTFASWAPELTWATADATYTATYTTWACIDWYKLDGDTCIINTEISTISITSDVTSIEAWILPEFTVSTTTPGVTVYPYWEYTKRRKTDNEGNHRESLWEPPVAISTWNRHFAQSVRINLDPWYTFANSVNIIFNGENRTNSGYTQLDIANYWSNFWWYIYIDLWTVTGENLTLIEDIVLIWVSLPIIDWSTPPTNITTNTTWIRLWQIMRGKGDNCTALSDNETFVSSRSNKYCLSIPITVQSWYVLKKPYYLLLKKDADQNPSRVTYEDKEYACTSWEIKVKDIIAKHEVKFMSWDKLLDTKYLTHWCSFWESCNGYSSSERTPDKEWYVFDSWYADENFTNKWYWGSSQVIENITLYAHRLQKIDAIEISWITTPINWAQATIEWITESPIDKINRWTPIWKVKPNDEPEQEATIDFNGTFTWWKSYYLYIPFTITEWYALDASYYRTTVKINWTEKDITFNCSSGNYYTRYGECNIRLSYTAAFPEVTNINLTWVITPVGNTTATVNWITLVEWSKGIQLWTPMWRQENSEFNWKYLSWTQYSLYIPFKLIDSYIMPQNYQYYVSLTINWKYFSRTIWATEDTEYPYYLTTYFTATAPSNSSTTPSNPPSSSSSWGWNWGWGWSTTTKPTEASTGDTAATNTWAINTEDNNNVINNPTEWSNQQDNPQTVLADGFTQEFHNAYEFAFKNGITTMPDIQNAAMYSPLTRIAMAKMLVYYAINVLHQTPNTSITVPEFPDVSAELNEQYGNAVTLAYQLWIMWINIENFRPFDEVTRAEFGTALSRMLHGTPDWDELYYEPHLAKLMQEKIITNDDPNLQELRGYVMIMLKRSAE